MEKVINRYECVAVGMKTGRDGIVMKVYDDSQGTRRKSGRKTGYIKDRKRQLAPDGLYVLHERRDPKRSGR